MPTARAVFWAATFGALALVVRSFWLGPVPLAVPVIALASYLIMYGLGIVMPRWCMFADVVEAAESGRHVVALTFDDGPDPETTPMVLEILARHRANATFFVIGRKAEQFPEMIRAIVGAGHELGLHGYSHSRVTAFRHEHFIEADLKRAQAVLAPFATSTLRWFRPPIGHVTLRIGRVAKRLGLTIVCWTVRGLDGLPGAEPRTVARRVEYDLEDGGIVALHEAFERARGVPAGVVALDGILSTIAARGWRSVTLTELLEGNQTPPATGSCDADSTLRRS
ncbi:MAG TPA: polysaccharide deacetylase family protein [Polyangiaceae bacterium]